MKGAKSIWGAMNRQAGACRDGNARAVACRGRCASYRPVAVYGQRRLSSSLGAPLMLPANRMAQHCCTRMQDQIEFTCSDHPDLDSCPDSLIRYSDKFREYGLRVHDGSSSSVSIAHCPWCGSKLPASLRTRWFDELAVLGIEDPLSQPVPQAFRSGAWWRVAG